MHVDKADILDIHRKGRKGIADSEGDAEAELVCFFLVKLLFPVLDPDDRISLPGCQHLYSKTEFPLTSLPSAADTVF